MGPRGAKICVRHVFPVKTGLHSTHPRQFDRLVNSVSPAPSAFWKLLLLLTEMSKLLGLGIDRKSLSPKL